MRDAHHLVAAYVDGELDAAERQRFESDMAGDPVLADQVALERRLRDRLAAAYDPVLAEAVPARLTLAAEAANDPSPRRSGLPNWAAVAASLVVGVLVGRVALPAQDQDPLAIPGALAQALDRQLADDAGPIRVGLSFRTAEGRYCRTFQSAPDRLAGLACRDDGDGWQARTITTWTPAAAADYRTAGVDGEPLDATAERAARERGWR